MTVVSAIYLCDLRGEDSHVWRASLRRGRTEGNHMTPAKLFVGTIVLSVAVSFGCCGTAPRGEWMKHAKYGVLLNFYGGQPQWGNQKFQDLVNAFDVQTLADQLDDAGVDYVIFTVGQNSGYFCSPNATYDKYVGLKPGERCSIRDLPDELADALATHDIKMMLYMIARAPISNKHAMVKLGDIWHGHAAPQEFQLRWEKVIREWSLRYKEKLAGWWFDAAYNTAGYDDLTKPANWNTWAEAARAGYPGRVLTFNPGQGLHVAFLKPTPQQDYTAGEVDEWGATPKENPAPEGMQWQILSFMGKYWGIPDGPYKPDEWMIDYIKTVNRQGGVVTIDVALIPGGTIYPPHLKQLIAIGKGLRETPETPKRERD